MLSDKRFTKKAKEDYEDYIEEETVDGEPEGIPTAASVDIEKGGSAAEDEFGAKDYRSLMSLKPDHESRALWVVSRVFMTFKQI